MFSFPDTAGEYLEGLLLEAATVPSSSLLNDLPLELRTFPIVNVGKTIKLAREQILQFGDTKKRTPKRSSVL